MEGKGGGYPESPGLLGTGKKENNNLAELNTLDIRKENLTI